MRVFINSNSHIRSKKGISLKECRNIRFHTDRIRIDSGKQMIHCCICSHRHSVNMTGRNACTFTHLCDHWIDCLFNYCILQFLLTTWFLLLNDTIDNICTKTDLSVSRGSLGKNLSSLHVEQNCGNSCGTNIHCKSAHYHLFIFSENIVYKKIIGCSANHTFYLKMIFPEYIRQFS